MPCDITWSTFAVIVALSDFGVAFVAGLVVFPVIFALGLQEAVGESTVGALFISLPGDVYFIDTLPVVLDPWDILIIVGGSVLIAFAATIFPARQASRLLPVEAIRHE